MSSRKLFARPKDSVAHVDLLRYPGVIVTKCEDNDGKLSVEAEVSEPLPHCPQCGPEGALTGNGTVPQEFWDMPFGIKPCWVSFRKQLYLCSSCGKPCGRDLPFLPSPKSQITPRLIRHIHALLDEGVPCMTISRWTGPDDSTIRDIRDRRDAERAIMPVRKTSGFLSLDDWKHGRRRKMRAILADSVYRVPIDLFRAITMKVLKEELGRYLAAHPEVKVIVIDMSIAFRNALRKYFPHLVIVIDHFHVKQALETRIARICDVMAEATAEAAPAAAAEQGNLFGEVKPQKSAKNKSKSKPKEPNKKRNPIAKKFRRYRRVWMKKPEKRTPDDRNLITAWSATYPDLRELLERRDALYQIWETATSGRDAIHQFFAWLRTLSDDLREKFAPFFKMVREWRRGIVAYFRYPERPTNAFAESMVREVKNWNRDGRGVSFEVLRERFKHYVPKNQKYSMDAPQNLSAALVVGEPEPAGTQSPRPPERVRDGSVQQRHGELA